MAKARTLDKRRGSIRNIRKITRTMELIANARFKKAMDRATSATAYTNRITQLVADLCQSGLDVQHPLLEDRPDSSTAPSNVHPALIKTDIHSEKRAIRPFLKTRPTKGSDRKKCSFARLPAVLNDSDLQQNPATTTTIPIPSQKSHT